MFSTMSGPALTLGDLARAYNHTFRPSDPWIEQIMDCPCGVTQFFAGAKENTDALVVCPKCKSWHTILWR